jgi:hypothetical protein
MVRLTKFVRLWGRRGGVVRVRQSDQVRSAAARQGRSGRRHARSGCFRWAPLRLKGKHCRPVARSAAVLLAARRGPLCG